MFPLLSRVPKNNLHFNGLASSFFFLSLRKTTMQLRRVENGRLRKSICHTFMTLLLDFIRTERGVESSRESRLERNYGQCCKQISSQQRDCSYITVNTDFYTRAHFLPSPTLLSYMKCRVCITRRRKAKILLALSSNLFQ